MLDDHKYSLYRLVAYSHPLPMYPESAYGPGGSARTYGSIVAIHHVAGESPRWEYTVRNSFTHEECRIPEDQIFHGANSEYLDFHRRDDIHWSRPVPQSGQGDISSSFWGQSLQEFIRTAVPRIRHREQEEEKARVLGRKLDLQPGDYIRLRGDFRDETEAYHNLYGKIVSVSKADRDYLHIPAGRPGIRGGKHKVLRVYHVFLDDGQEIDIYDVEVKTVYTSHGRKVIHNWRATTFLAEAFGDPPPYDLQIEYLNGHVFSRAELSEKSQEELAELLARLLYGKGLILLEEVPEKTKRLRQSPREYLVDQILVHSRFDMRRNQQLTDAEIESIRLRDSELRKLFG